MKTALQRLLITLLTCIVASCSMQPVLAQGSLPNSVFRFIPPLATKYAPLLREEQEYLWEDHPEPKILAGLIEQESCISLKHSRCWNPASQLKTSREEGAGFGQITRAYKTDGSLRFDSLAAMRSKYPTALGAWNWQNVYTRPDLQLRALVLMSRDNYKGLSVIKDPIERLKFTDAAYNGGLTGVMNDMRACGLRAGCNPQYWFNNVEETCTKSKAVLYGNRNACDINREHVVNVMLYRSNKYEIYFK